MIVQDSQLGITHSSLQTLDHLILCLLKHDRRFLN
jgi:hypothetical protein